jgi:hypothetical protein
MQQVWRCAFRLGLAVVGVLLASSPAFAQGDTFCWRDNYGRGVGVPLSVCGAGQERNGLLCYPQCEAGFHGVGPVCWSNCAEGYVDDGVTCRKPGDIQAKNSYGRGAGQAMVCAPGREQQAGLCYSSCGSDWRGEATVCYQNCPAGYRDDGLYCGKPESYGRGAGYAAWDMGVCEAQHGKGQCEWYGAIIYPKCKANFHNAGCCVCSPDCPPGWEDIGVSCKKPARGRGVGVAVDSCPPGSERNGALCYPACRAGYTGAGPVCWSQCPAGYQDDGATCRKDPIIVGKQSHGRGAGVPMLCAEGLQESAGLCYAPCDERSSGIGPVCWRNCPSSLPYDCGAACAVSEGDCIDAIQKMLITGAKMAVDVITFGGSTYLDVKDALPDAASALARNADNVAVGAGAQALSSGISGGLRAGIKNTLKELLLPFSDVLDLSKTSTYSTVAGWTAFLQEANEKVQGGLTGGHILALMSTQMTAVEQDALVSELALAMEDEQVIDPYTIVSQFPLTNPFGILDFVDTFRKGYCSEYPDTTPAGGGLQPVFEYDLGPDGFPLPAPFTEDTVQPDFQYPPGNTLGVLLTGGSKPSNRGVLKVAKAGVDRSKITAVLEDQADPRLVGELESRFKSGKLFSSELATSSTRSAPSPPPAPVPPASAGARLVVGVNSGGGIYSRPSDGSGAWTQVAGGLKHVSVGTVWTWGVNAADNIFKCPTPCTGAWVQVPGALKQIDVSDSAVWGVNAADAIYTRPADGSGAWVNIPGRLKHVSVSRDWVWGVNSADNIYKCRQPCTGSWVQVAGALKQIDVSGASVWGVNSADMIYTLPADGSGSWAQVPGRLKHVSVGDGWVWGVNSGDNIYQCKSPCSGSWAQVAGSLMQIDVSGAP